MLAVKLQTVDKNLDHDDDGTNAYNSFDGNSCTTGHQFGLSQIEQHNLGKPAPSQFVTL